MVLYHGTDSESAKDILQNGIRVKEGNESTDFGQGFYTTESLKFAIKSANRASKRTDNPPALLQFDFDSNKARGIKFFRASTKEWAQFIVNNRCGLEYVAATKTGEHNLDGKFEIVQGRIADGNVVDFAQDCLEKTSVVTDEDAKMIYSESYPEQITFHSQRSIRLLRNGREIPIEGGEIHEKRKEL